MSDEEDCGAWVRFSEVGINARMRNAMELFALRKEKGALSAPSLLRSGRETAGFERLPVALTWGAGAEDAATGLASEDGGELVTAAGSTGSAVAGQQPLSAPAFTGASADLKWVKRG